MGDKYVERLIYYLDRSMEQRGRVLSIKIEKICKTDKKCSWYIYKLMTLIEEEKLVYKWRKGTWIMKSDNIELIKKRILTLI